jgi:hypothetical protein
MKAFALYTCSELGGVHVIAGMMATEGRKKEESTKKKTEQKRCE